MNTSALKRFAQQARNILKSGVEKQLISWGYNPKTKQFTIEPQPIFGGMMFGEKMIDDPTVYPKWLALKKAIQTKGVNQVVEEAAYTWFNRLIAIQILAKNNYIVPQLEYASATTHTPMMVQNAKRGITPTLDAVQQKQLHRLLDDDRLETELFALLITAYCHQSDLLQRVFGRLDDYTELLLPADILATNGFIDLLNTSNAITDEDYRQVELIGWLYQFYISEKKDEVFKSFKNKKKAEAEDIPAATQIFTPNWIVKYMVQNTVGRLWLDLNPNSRLRESMKYLVESDNATPNNTQSSDTHNSLPFGEGRGGALISEVAHLKLLDPASGSGHILVEGFDLLYAMYREEGYTASEAVRSIFENNLFGLDIDPRAAQLATFALLLKAAAQDRTILDKKLLPHVYAMPEKEIFTPQEVLDFLGEANATYTDTLYNALELMRQSQNLGSIMKFNFTDEGLAAIAQQTNAWKALQPTDLLQQDLWRRLAPYMQVLQVLTQKYEAVAANPPYMGGGNMNDSLKEYVNSNYPKSKSDLFSVFMEVCMDYCQPTARMGMINMHSWMFLSSFEALRKFIIETYHIENMLHLGPRTFDELSGEVVQNTAFVLQNSTPNKTGTYFRLVDGGNSTAKHQMFLNAENRFSNISQANFEKIPKNRIGYWASDKYLEIFQNSIELSSLAYSDGKNVTSQNDLYLRFLWEVSKNKIGIDSRWMLMTKGGENRKFYGNTNNIMDWSVEARNFYRKSKAARLIPEYLWYYQGITWSKMSSGGSFRLLKKECTFDEVNITFNDDINIPLILAFLNSKIPNTIFKILNPTSSLQTENILELPIANDLLELSDNNIFLNLISIAKTDWDSRETSWDFEKHPLTKNEQTNLQSAYQAWEETVTQDFYQLHANETELNRIFIDIYGLQDELTPEVKLKDITILQEELNSNALGDATEPIGTLPIKQDVVMRQLISYLMGCLMGRYRLDKPGLHIAHPSPTAEETAAYSYNGYTVEIDDDAIIPLMDSTSSFADNALIRIKHLLEAQWGGDKQLIETINYLQATLGKDLETYLVKDFWKDHCSRYQKRPIYWLFASPKGAFQVVTYMHRMNKYTVEKIRSNYLLVHIRNLENQYNALKANDANLNRDEAKRMEKVEKDLIECRDYDLLLKDLADHQIDFDLDDGVAVNYAKFESVVAAVK